MDRTALVIGASGQIGRAVVERLVRDGWQVRAGSRGVRATDPWPADWAVQPVRLDRDDDTQLAEAVGAGCDVVIDTVAYGARHARQLIGLADRIGSAVVVSTAAVYQDEAGRSFGADDLSLPLPVPETQPTVAPGPETDYAPGKAALERELLAAGSTLPTTLLRAGAVHGPHAIDPREWYFVKRALDDRPVRVLAHNGTSRFHPVSTLNLAELVQLAADQPGSRVLNAGDPEAPTVREIGAAVHAVMGHGAEEVLIDGPSPARPVGVTPWSIPRPFVLDMTRARDELGYRPVTGYAESLPATVEWLVSAAAGRDWREVFPGLTNYRTDLFDYPAEDAWLSGRG